jgi:hypothetical protein
MGRKQIVAMTTLPLNQKKWLGTRCLAFGVAMNPILRHAKSGLDWCSHVLSSLLHLPGTATDGAAPRLTHCWK